MPQVAIIWSPAARFPASDYILDQQMELNDQTFTLSPLGKCLKALLPLEISLVTNMCKASFHSLRPLPLTQSRGEPHVCLHAFGHTSVCQSSRVLIILHLSDTSVSSTFRLWQPGSLMGFSQNARLSCLAIVAWFVCISTSWFIQIIFVLPSSSFVPISLAAPPWSHAGSVPWVKVTEGGRSSRYTKGQNTFVGT